MILTIHGPLDPATLAKTVGFEDRPTEFVVWVEWRLKDELVRRDAHVILKEMPAALPAAAGVLGG